ncbi:hypothetical protein AB205_0181050 [Aquarana catesbeiana]|uniref:Secreted protein n=1 Tax=Aquarana catesbeiana TaxID=8400 RepID=A0A2G9NB39_AQUCT|nr:hypothetical protein AB205_0181050 [Aquarana catesbeiana]
MRRMQLALMSFISKLYLTVVTPNLVFLSASPPPAPHPLQDGQHQRGLSVCGPKADRYCLQWIATNEANDLLCVLWNKESR